MHEKETKIQKHHNLYYAFCDAGLKEAHDVTEIAGIRDYLFLAFLMAERKDERRLCLEGTRDISRNTLIEKHSGTNRRSVRGDIRWRRNTS